MEWILISIIAVAVAIVSFLLIKFRAPNVETGVEAIKSLLVFFVDTLVKDKKKAAEIKKWTDIIAIAWIRTEISKNDIISEMVRKGEDPKDIDLYHSKLLENALDIAVSVGRELGYTVDDTITYWIKEGVKYICLFFRKPKLPNIAESGEPLFIDLSKIQPKKG